MNTTRGPTLLEALDDVEKSFDLGRRERGSRLVHDEETRLGRKRLRDLEQLTVRDSESAHGTVRAELRPELAEQRLRAAPHLAPVDRGRTGTRLPPSEDVLGNAQVLKDRRLLVHRGYDTTWWATAGADLSNPQSNPVQVLSGYDGDVFLNGGGEFLIVCVPRPLAPVEYLQLHASSAKGTTNGPVVAYTTATNPSPTTTNTNPSPTTTTTTAKPPPVTSTAATTTTTTTTGTTTATPPPTTTSPTPKPPLPKSLLPNRTRTPGVTNPAVTQTTIKTTICVSGWTAKVRPPASFTNALKLKQMRQYGVSGKPAAYEEDYLIPLELGGAPRDPKNLWPEPHNQSTHSDPLETALKRKVCAGNLTLAQGRAQILAYKKLHG